MDRFLDRALVLSTVDYGEADRIVTLFTEQHGKLSAFATGARKSKRRFAGALEPFTLLRARLAERRGSTYRLDEVDIERGFFGIRDDLTRISRALYCMELCRELTRDREAHPELFARVIAYLEKLERKDAGPTSLIAFELEMLAHAGFMPRFDRCALCEGPVGGRPQFDPEHGGAVCQRCAERARFGVPVLPEVVAALAALQSGAKLPLPRELRGRARELLNQFIQHHIGRKLKSVDFLAEIGLD